jgi:pimeloyl-ACP methyl ester carboxylesterase
MSATALPFVDGVSHHYVDAGGLRMHVAEAGPPDGEPVVLLHGWPQHWYEWRHVVPLLADRYRLVMPDLRGLGWTDAPRDGYLKEQLARDVVALLDAMGLGRVKLIGHDWGGFVGFLLCLSEPSRVERYLVMNIIHPWPRRRARGILDSWRVAYQLPLVAPILGPRVTRRTGYVGTILRRANPGVFSDEEVEAFAAPLREPARAAATAGYYRTFLRHELPALAAGRWRSQRLTVPTLYLFGTKDFAMTPDTARGFEPYADDMRLELVDGVGHFIVDERPDLVARRALEFFAAR